MNGTDIKAGITAIYKLVVKLRDTLVDLIRKKEITSCGCGQADCPTWFFTDSAGQEMDDIRRSILVQFKSIKTDFNLSLG
ncbi:hypothetical protein RG47T_1575 [Mucilaginibacter polytrichastri]|uniref:Uncharacterized protein n=1 Tax=Mucilaginibacter polytrichastri TaxID=1302689 RepID=A0A1Q5ZWI8_9SPHI|nr:hypothetical protein RG47T_1575 [Mucilaginibacter polytrichastri]